MSTKEKEGKIKKPRRARRHKSGEKALKEIKYYQRITRSIIPVAAIRRVIRKALLQEKPSGVYLQQKAFEMLHEAAEDYLVRLFEKANFLTLHAKRKTLMLDDLKCLDNISNPRKCAAPSDKEDTLPIKKKTKKEIESGSSTDEENQEIEEVIEREESSISIEVEELSLKMNEQEQEEDEYEWCLEEC